MYSKFLKNSTGVAANSNSNSSGSPPLSFPRLFFFALIWASATTFSDAGRATSCAGCRDQQKNSCVDVAVTSAPAWKRIFLWVRRRLKNCIGPSAAAAGRREPPSSAGLPTLSTKDPLDPADTSGRPLTVKLRFFEYESEVDGKDAHSSMRKKMIFERDCGPVQGLRENVSIENGLMENEPKYPTLAQRQVLVSVDVPLYVIAARCLTENPEDSDSGRWHAANGGSQPWREHKLLVQDIRLDEGENVFLLPAEVFQQSDNKDNVLTVDVVPFVEGHDAVTDIQKEFHIGLAKLRGIQVLYELAYKQVTGAFSSAVEQAHDVIRTYAAAQNSRFLSRAAGGRIPEVIGTAIMQRACGLELRKTGEDEAMNTYLARVRTDFKGKVYPHSFVDDDLRAVKPSLK